MFYDKRLLYIVKVDVEINKYLVPKQPPIGLAQMTKYLSVSTASPLPIKSSHHPRVGLSYNRFLRKTREYNTVLQSQNAVSGYL